MVEIKVEIPEEVKLDTSELEKGIKEFVRLRIMRDLLLKWLDDLLENSELTEEECVELGRMIKKGRFKQLKEMGLV